MVFTFVTPMSVQETCDAIKATVLSMNGKVKDLSRGRLKATWKTNLKKSGVFDHSCAFYVGDGVVRAITDFKDTEVIVMVFRKLTKPLAFWDVFLTRLIQRCPEADFGITAGIPELTAIQFIGDGTEQVMVSKTANHPAWGKAAIGGMLFGPAGAIIGGTGGKSHTTTTTQTKVSAFQEAMVRYSNGLVFRGKMFNNGTLHQEILANMNRLSDQVGR